MSKSDARQLRLVAGTDRVATLKELIAESGVPLRGLELMPQADPTQPKDAATAAQIAAMEFEPWKMDHPPGKPGPSAKAMNHLGVSARISAGLVERSKSELIGLWRDTTSHEALFQTLDSLQEAAEIMKSLASMIENAHLRLLVAVHAYAAEIGVDTEVEEKAEAVS
jgi:hypothetical protein